MKNFIFLLFLIMSCNSFTQIHNRLIKINVGITNDQIRIKEDIINFNDTSLTNSFNHHLTLPTLSFSEEFTLNNRFSLAGTIGHQYFNIDYNNQKYGTQLVYGSINPQLSIFYKAGFEYYIKLKLGVNYRIGNLTSIPEYTQRLFPQKVNIMTGVTIVGLNYFINNKWGLNTELSIWSQQIVTFGVSYRFFKGEYPKDINPDGYYTD